MESRKGSESASARGLTVELSCGAVPEAGRSPLQCPFHSVLGLRPADGLARALPCRASVKGTVSFNDLLDGPDQAMSVPHLLFPGAALLWPKKDVDRQPDFGQSSPILKERHGGQTRRIGLLDTSMQFEPLFRRPRRACLRSAVSVLYDLNTTRPLDDSRISCGPQAQHVAQRS